MNSISAEDLKRALDALNEKYPRPHMAPLTVSEFCDVQDLSAPWPNAELPGVYALFNAQKDLLYIGKASCDRSLGYRVRDYFDRNGMPKSQEYRDARLFKTIAVPKNRAFEAPAIEEFLICELNPPLNRNGRTRPIKN